MLKIFSIANCFIKLFKENNKNLTHMKLQALIYYSYGFCLHYENKKIIENEFVALAFGVVNLDLYKEVKKCNCIHNVQNEFLGLKQQSNKEYLDLLRLVNMVYEAFKDWNNNHFFKLFNKKQSAWYKAMLNEVIEIKDADILTEVAYIIKNYKED